MVPDLQGDMQVMFNDVYPEFFPISGDLNIKDTGINVGRYLTTVVMLMIILSFIAGSMCFLCFCTEALASLVPLCNNVAFKAYILFLVLFASLGFYCLMVRVPSAFWKKRFYRSLQFVPTTVICFCIVLFGAHEFDLHCTQDHWQPMIKIVAQLYAPDGMNVTDLQGYLGYVAFNPLVRTPTLQLPTMERSIPHDELLERSEYYVSEIFFLILVTCFLVELLSRLFTIFLKRRVNSVDEENVPLVQPSSSSSSKASSSQWYYCYMSLFVVWYILYQVLLYILMDIMVMCGTVNLVTGPAWEFWVPFIIFVCFTHLLTALVRYVRNIGVRQQSPTSMIIASLVPFFGNEIHIFKDHVAGAICFAVAPCSQGSLRTAALTLGYCSLAATFTPVFFLVIQKKARAGLVRAHWPILEAAEPEPACKRSELQFASEVGVMESGEFLINEDEKANEMVVVIATYANFEDYDKARHDGSLEEELTRDALIQKVGQQHPELRGVVRRRGVHWTDVNNEEPPRSSISKESQFPLTCSLKFEVSPWKLEVLGQAQKKVGSLLHVVEVGSRVHVVGLQNIEGGQIWRVKLVGGSEVLVPASQISTCNGAKLCEVGGCRPRAHLVWYKGKQRAMEYAQICINALIPAVTIEKQVRAFVGEIPHAILHVSFIFFFGGSIFIICAIMLSVFKVVAIPIIREQVLPDLIPKHGCSVASLRRYRSNTPHIYLFNEEISIFDCIEKFNWVSIKNELLQAGADTTDHVSTALRNAAVKGNGKQLRDAFEEVSQDTKFVLVEAVFDGEVEDVKALMQCGFDSRSAYSHPEIYDGQAVPLNTIIAFK